MIRVNDRPTDWEPGLTVAGLIARQGFSPTTVAVWIDDEFVARRAYDATKVPDNATVVVVLMAPGG